MQRWELQQEETQKCKKYKRWDSLARQRDLDDSTALLGLSLCGATFLPWCFPLHVVETPGHVWGQAFSLDGQVWQQENLMSVWLRSCPFSEAEYQKWEWAAPIWKDVFLKCSNIQMYNQAVPKKQLTKRRMSYKVIFLFGKQYISRSSALCQVANKGRILHSWDHVAGAIRLMGFGLNSRPTLLRRTNAGFFQMSVSTVLLVENCFIARKRARWF